MTSAMKTNLTSISLTSLLVLLAATAAGLTGASIPAALSAETMLATFAAAGALCLFFLDYARSPRPLRPLVSRSALRPRLQPAMEAFSRGNALALRRSASLLN
jgi:hypothetical protein